MTALHVLARGQARNEVVELKDEADVLAAKARELRLGRAGELVVQVMDLARRRRVRPRAQDAEQRGLAAAGAEQHDVTTKYSRRTVSAGIV